MLEVDFGLEDVDLGYCFILVYLILSVVAFGLNPSHSAEGPWAKIVANSPMAIKRYLACSYDHLTNVK